MSPHCNKLTPIRGSKSYIAVMESSGRSLLLTAEALRLPMVDSREGKIGNQYDVFAQDLCVQRGNIE